MFPEDANVDVLEEARRLFDAWCERHSYDVICTMWSGLRSLNGLTDGWEEFLQALKRLRALAKDENGGMTEAEVQKVSTLISIVSRALTAR